MPMSHQAHYPSQEKIVIRDASPAFYRIADVMKITALSRATLYRRMADGRFPPPVRLGGRACGWKPADLQEWIEDPQGYTSKI